MFMARDLTETALLAAAIAITGAIKLPSLVPGLEFQLSAPIAVAICAVFGFKKYIAAGTLSSAVALLLGTHHLVNVAIAMEFRMIVGMTLLLGQNKWPALVLAGPLGTLFSRLTLWFILGEAAIGAALAALPGMLLTMAAAPMLTKILSRIKGAAAR